MNTKDLKKKFDAWYSWQPSDITGDEIFKYFEENVIAPLLQNKTSNSEATVLSAKEMVHKHFAHKVTFSFGGNMTPIHGKEINANEIVAAMEEYKNQEVNK